MMLASNANRNEEHMAKQNKTDYLVAIEPVVVESLI